MNNPSGKSPYSKKSIQRLYGTSFSDGNRVKLVWKDRDSFRDIFNSISNATRLICLQFYIFRNDETGNELASILKRKASDGVRVYIIYDHFGSFGTPRSFWKELKASGVSVGASRPFKWSAPFHYVHRDHRKLIIIDGLKAFTGGLNIANEYRGYNRFRRIKGWRDTGIFLEGPIVARLTDEFAKSWQIWSKEPFQDSQSPAYTGDDISVLPVFASSAKGRRRMRKLIYYSINSAQTSICLTTAYFIPSRRMLHILESAVSRGVSVRLLLPGVSDVSAAYFAGRAFFSRLLKAGIEIYTYKGEILHAKTYLFDRKWSIIGSANLDFQSLRRNDEGNVGILDERFGSEMESVFNDDLTRSGKIDLVSWKDRPLHEKIKEHLFALFRRRL